MTDYGRPVSFGIFPSPAVDGLEAMWQAVRIADEDGLDLIGVQDHPYQRRFVDTFTLLTAMVMRTQHVTVFPDVANLPLRPPAVLAKMAASIDILGNGRFELGLGAGAFWEAIDAMGEQTRTPGESLRALREAVDVVRLMWSDERSVRYEGRHYRLSGVKPGPAPVHRIGVWLGVYGPRALRLLGEVADGWLPSIPSMPVDELNGRHSIIDEAAVEAGRDPATIRRLANVKGTITDGVSRGFLDGPPDQWIEQLTLLAVDHGIDSFILWSDDDLVDQTGRLAAIAQDVRAAIEAERAGSS